MTTTASVIAAHRAQSEHDGIRFETYAAQRPSRSYGDLPLSDVTHAAWTVVATSPEPGQWNYLLSPRDVTLLRMARDSGKLVTVMVRVDGGFELRARAVRGWGR